MLGDPRGQSLEVEGNVLTVLVATLDPDRDGPLDRDGDPLDREAAFVVGVDLVAAADDLRIDERCNLVVLGDEDEDPAQDADLRGGETNAVRILHQSAHASDEAAQVVVELLHWARLHAQDRVGVLPDLRECELPPRFLLGIELFGTNLAFDVLHVSSGHTSGVQRREREAILKQGVTSPETPRDRREREALAEDIRGNPLAGEPLRQRLRNFRPDAGAQLAALGGPVAWMRRLRAIEIAVDLHESQLAETWDALRLECGGDAERFARSWRECAERWDFHEVNDLIERHNRYYPAESRLPMNPRTGDFVPINGRPYTREPLDANWILTRFPVQGQT
jgi:hypothetical protein